MAYTLIDKFGVAVCVETAEKAEKLKAAGYKPAAEAEEPKKTAKKKTAKKV